LPTLLKHAGVDFLHLGGNPVGPSSRFPRLFYWQGVDGSRVLCSYPTETGSDILPPKDWPSRNYLAVMTSIGNQGPLTLAELEDLRNRAARNHPGVKVHFGTLDDFLKAVEAENPELPVVRGDTAGTWIDDLMFMPQATKLARDIRPLEPALDSLDTHLNLYGLHTAPLAGVLARAYENSLLYGQHNWGLYGDFGNHASWPPAEWRKELSREHQQRFLKLIDDHGAYIRAADEIVRSAMQARLKQLAQSVRGAPPRLLIWNVLPWTRSGLIDVGGRQLYVVDVPPNGYRTFPASFVVASTEVDSFYTPFYRVTFDLQRGGIASLVEKKTERELVDKSSPYALGQFLHEHFSRKEVAAFFKSNRRMSGGGEVADFAEPGMPDTPYAAVSPAGWKLSAWHSPFTDVAVLRAGDLKGLAQACTLKFTFSRYSDSVEVEWSITNKMADKIPQGGWLCFPFAVEKPQFALGRLVGLVNPATDMIPGANPHLFAVATGVSITGTRQDSVSLCPLDSPLVSLDRPGLWRYDLDVVPRKPSVFVNLYNDNWNTNFPLARESSWSERVCFWPGKDLVTRSWESRLPLLAVVVDGPSGELPERRAGLSISRPGVLVTAFGHNPDGAGTLLRVWEQSGTSGNLTVMVPGEFRKATPVNLRGETAGKPVSIHEGKLGLNLRAYAPASYVLE
jgi:alpha-mannosidase